MHKTAPFFRLAALLLVAIVTAMSPPRPLPAETIHRFEIYRDLRSTTLAAGSTRLALTRPQLSYIKSEACPITTLGRAPYDMYMDSVNTNNICRVKSLAIFAGVVLLAEIVASTMGVDPRIAVVGMVAVATSILALAGAAITYLMHQYFMALVVRTENFHWY